MTERAWSSPPWAPDLIRYAGGFRRHIKPADGRYSIAVVNGGIYGAERNAANGRIMALAPEMAELLYKIADSRSRFAEPARALLQRANDKTT